MYQQVHKYNLDCGGGELLISGWEGLRSLRGYLTSLNETLVIIIWDVNLGNSYRVKVHAFNLVVFTVEPLYSGHHWGMKFCPLKRGAYIAQVDLY